MAQVVKRLPTTRETRVQSLRWEDLLEKEMATQSSILAWKIPWTEEPGGLQVQVVAKSLTRLRDFTFQATALQLLSLCSRAQEPQLLKPKCPRDCAPQEKPPQ